MELKVNSSMIYCFLSALNEHWDSCSDHESCYNLGKLHRMSFWRLSTNEPEFTFSNAVPEFSRNDSITAFDSNFVPAQSRCRKKRINLLNELLLVDPKGAREHFNSKRPLKAKSQSC